jgi:class 3 adenylate cyclase
MAVGPVLLLEGDDYVGSAVNLASRLCAKAAPGELLATDELTSDVPKSAEVISVGALDVSGFAQSVEVVRIQARTQIDLAAAG